MKAQKYKRDRKKKAWDVIKHEKNKVISWLIEINTDNEIERNFLQQINNYKEQSKKIDMKCKYDLWIKAGTSVL